MSIDRKNLPELRDFRTVIGALCLVYLGRMGWTAPATLSAVSTVLVSMSASFLAIWLFSIKEGHVKIKFRAFELEGPACEVLLWLAGVLVIAGTFAIVSPEMPNSERSTRRQESNVQDAN